MINAYLQPLINAGLNMHHSGDLVYFVTEATPKIVITSGLHGDEWEVIPMLTSAIATLKNQLPPFLCIPILSPSAVAQKTRINKNGIDLNRAFDRIPEDAEVTAIKLIMKEYGPYETLFSVHQDLEVANAYLYDGSTVPNGHKIKLWQEKMRAGNIPLLNGYDDLMDADLQIFFKDGYYHLKPTNWAFFEGWSNQYVKVSRNLTLEVPGFGQAKDKEYVVKQSLMTLI